MSEKAEQLRDRTKQFAVRIMRLVRSLPQRPDCQIVGRQLLRSATSAGANYRAVCRSRSRAEFVSKLSIVVEETDEALFWIELLMESGALPRARLEPLRREAEELTAIFAVSRRTARSAVTS